MITIKVFKGRGDPRIAHVKNKKDLITWVNLLHGEFEEIQINMHKENKKVSFRSKGSFDEWAKN